ncbi:MAG TPA: hypothetical protein VIF09_09270, partial [Polyangiaceae bacterium]
VDGQRDLPKLHRPRLVRDERDAASSFVCAKGMPPKRSTNLLALMAVSSDPMDLGFRTFVTAGLLDAQARAGNALGALTSRERKRQFQLQLTAMQHGIVRDSPDSAELEALDRKMATTGTLSPTELARASTLRATVLTLQPPATRAAEERDLADALAMLPVGAQVLVYEARLDDFVAWRIDGGSSPRSE